MPEIKLGKRNGKRGVLQMKIVNTPFTHGSSQEHFEMLRSGRAEVVFATWEIRVSGDLYISEYNKDIDCRLVDIKT
ncbi:hypothetical protein ACHQM5_002714 [Ranunculus cassubicifolius]